MTMQLVGTVADGMGVGAKKMALLLACMETNPDAFPIPLRRPFFAGTLNISLSAPWETPKEGVLRVEKEAYGGDMGISFVQARISHENGLSCDCWIVRPDRTRHSQEVIEVIAEKKLRDALGIDTGSSVNVTILI